MGRRLWIKRIIDLMVAGGALIVLSPVIGIVAFLVRIRLGRPVLFRHTRPGYKAEPFELYKFRSMLEVTDTDGNLLPDGQRLTAFGRFLRRFSLDELPQLWNVIRGEMSLVGPRPLLMEYLDRYDAEQIRRHDVKPGITGLAQISGRNAIAWEEKFALDVWYADHWSLWLDARILAGTVAKVIKGDGISAKGMATIARFGEESEQYK